MWVHCKLNDTTQQCDTVAVSSRCQIGRCQNHNTINKSSMSEICAIGREGRLCGMCHSNYSVSLGSLECVETENSCSITKTVLLLCAFIIAGILLVCFLAIFNFTVAEGTINGLLFYANCVHGIVCP